MHMPTFKSRVKRAIDPRVSGAMRRSLPAIAPGLQRAAQYWPHASGIAPYSRTEAAASGELPVPPRDLWADYGDSPDAYLASGLEDVTVMRKILAASGAPVEDAGRILDLGCAGGRMIRHLADVTPYSQVWGCDIWGSAIEWCQGHLSPPYSFATTTVAPHLPFADASFGLVYCGSLFTHIDDLAEAWWLELHRIIRPGGRLVFSVNDRHAADIITGRGNPAAHARYRERAGARNWDGFASMLTASPEYQRFRRGEAWMVSLGRDTGMSHVLWDADTLSGGSDTDGPAGPSRPRRTATRRS